MNSEAICTHVQFSAPLSHTCHAISHARLLSLIASMHLLCVAAVEEYKASHGKAHGGSKDAGDKGSGSDTVNSSDDAKVDESTRTRGRKRKLSDVRQHFDQHKSTPQHHIAAASSSWPYRTSLKLW